MRSSPQLRSSVEGRKKHLIHLLIHLLINNGIYKKSERHLYELSLGELESEYKYVRKVRAHGET
ncbi:MULTISPECIES: Fur-regulated basic protein FbpA [Bacillus amyloliquefaciens group]|uniref:Fur-regulated basic protein FbpA n=1 Tax=Bacillus amyloliquefaciens group TaxID=1938374 RepID=UPI001F4D0A66|nr:MULTISPECIES: Fur-regulated basic protein FbpA [Bacillus amyloliquefaciens group]MED3511180.1 Fur-regulated basic protein FbpA [Bacillus velezensis]